MTNLNLVHISDFHCTDPPTPFHKKIVEDLLDDFESLHDPIDFVVFTGDLTESGSAREFEAAIECLLDPVAKKCNLTRDRIIVGPGNHDICWKDIDPDSERGLAEILVNSEAVSELFGDERRLSRSVERLNNFNHFQEEWYEGTTNLAKSHPLAKVSTFSDAASSVGIAVLNSAWRSGEQSDKDHLLIGELQVASALQAIEGSDFRIVMFHHPVDWLQEQDQRAVTVWLQRKAHLVLTGHTHIPDPAFHVTPAGSTVYSGAGCLYQSADYQNAYSVLRIQLNDQAFSIEMDIHPYSPSTGFSVISASSSATLTVSDIPYVARDAALVEALPTPAVVGRHLAELAERNSVIANHIAKKNPSSVREIFVDPVFLPMPYTQLAKELGGSNYQKHHVDAGLLLEEAACLAVCGDSESGLSGALLWLLDSVSPWSAPTIPIFLESTELIAGPTLLDQAVRRHLADLGVSVGRTDPLPRLAIAVDDAQRLKGRQLEHIMKFHTRNPEHLLILGWHDERLQVSEQLNNFDSEYNVCYLGPLSIPQLQDLVRKLTPEASSDVVETVLKILASENLPRTPYVMSLLAILVAEGASQFEGLSESVLLDRYVSHLLELAAGGENSRVALDPDNWSRILEHLAHRFRSDGARYKTRLEVDEFVMSYLKSLGWGDTVYPIIEQLLEWRLLAQSGDQVSLWHPSLLDIFLGRQMNTEFKMAIADTEGSYVLEALSAPLDHTRPIQHAAALAKGNLVILNRIAEFDADTFETRGVELTGQTLPALTSGWSKSDDLEDLVRQVKLHVASPQEREAMRIKSWDEFEAAHADDVPPESFGDSSDLDLIAELLATVRLFSSVLRSSEHTADPKLKKELLARALDQWSTVALLTLAEEDVYRTASEFLLGLYQSRGERPPKGDNLEAFISRLVHLLFAAFISIDMHESLGTRKLNEILSELLSDDEYVENPARALFGTLLYSELESDKGSQWLDFFERLFRDHRSYLVVLDVMTVSLKRRYYFGPIREQDRDRLASLIADVTLDVNGVSSQARRSQSKPRLITELRQHRLEIEGSGSVPAEP